MNKIRTKDLNDSSRAFESIVDTTLQKLIKGSVKSCEGQTSDTSSLGFMMDVHSGIDYISINENGVRGMAVRCQWGVDYRTFTIRYHRNTGTKTEYEKRKYQIEHDYLYPEFTIQCYFRDKKNNELLSIAVVRTKDLYQVIEDKFDTLDHKESNNEFLVVHFNDIPKDKIKTWYAPSKLNIDLDKIRNINNK